MYGTAELGDLDARDKVWWRSPVLLGSIAAARLFDVRRVIGGLFVVYGVIVTVIGLFDSPEELDKAQGVRINLWTGLGMLALGAVFLIWQWWRPAEPPQSDLGNSGLGSEP